MYSVLYRSAVFCVNKGWIQVETMFCFQGVPSEEDCFLIRIVHQRVSVTFIVFFGRVRLTLLYCRTRPSPDDVRLGVLDVQAAMTY